MDATDPAGMLGKGIALLDDLDGDGARDLAVSRQGFFFDVDRSRVIFFSGRTGARLGATTPLSGTAEIGPPRSVADADADGLRDVFVFETTHLGVQSLALYSSASGLKLRE